jgi:hypothetical protein
VSAPVSPSAARPDRTVTTAVQQSPSGTASESPAEDLDSALVRFRSEFSRAQQLCRQYQEHLSYPDFKDRVDRDAELAELHKRSGFDLARAEMKAQRGLAEHDAALVAEATELAASAREACEHLNAPWTEIERRRRQVWDRLLDRAASAQRLATGARELATPGGQEVGRLRSTLEGLLAEVAGLEERTSTARLEELTARLDQVAQRLRSALEQVAPPPTPTRPPTAVVRPPGPTAPPTAPREPVREATPRTLPTAAPDVPIPPGLRTAVELFLAGRYGEANERLRAASVTEPRQRAVAALVCSAASFQLYLAGGRTTPDLLDEARRCARESVALDRDLRLPEDLFSPRFREFFRQARSPAR